MKEYVKIKSKYAGSFLKWLVISVIVGTVSGVVGTAFHSSLEFATHFRSENSYVINLLPLGGLVIVFLYKKLGNLSLGTNDVIKSVRGEGKVPFIMAPLIFAGTFITHIFGGSAGREGAALQLGGSIASFFGKIFKLNEKDTPIIIMCGMSGVFSALFGTPLTASVFAFEVISVGIIHCSAILPCLFSSVCAFLVATFFGVEPVKFSLSVIPELTALNILKIIVLGIIFSASAILFCMSMKYAGKMYEKFIKSPYIRVFAGGIIIVLLTHILKTYDYNGAGMDVITRAMNGNARPEAFLLKIIFTALTINAGFKGGEIVPTFFIGSTLGCVLGGLVGLDASFCAALGIVSLFAGVVNCPIASMILALELFGGEGIVLFALSVAICFFLSGYTGLYGSQKIIYSKEKAEYININTKH